MATAREVFIALRAAVPRAYANGMTTREEELAAWKLKRAALKPKQPLGNGCIRLAIPIRGSPKKGLRRESLDRRRESGAVDKENLQAVSSAAPCEVSRPSTTSARPPRAVTHASGTQSSAART